LVKKLSNLVGSTEQKHYIPVQRIFVNKMTLARGCLIAYLSGLTNSFLYMIIIFNMNIIIRFL